ncbi:MAG: GPP34 family phosphoprotein, partial [Dehalococcoidia bacterium]
VDDGAVLLLLSHEAPSSDPLAHRVFGLIRRDWQQGHRRDAGTWVKALAVDARDQVGGRLVDAGTVTREAGRRMFRRSPVPVYPATSPEQAAYATTRLHAALHAYPMRTADVVIAAVVQAVGLFSHLTYGCERAHPADEQLTAAMPMPLRTLLRRTRVAIAESTLSPR